VDVGVEIWFPVVGLGRWGLGYLEASPRSSSLS